MPLGALIEGIDQGMNTTGPGCTNFQLLQIKMVIF
jgi:hypothetical protein